jgi:hypothetical protein
MGIPSDRRFLAVASKHLRHPVLKIPGQAGYFKAPARVVMLATMVIAPAIPILLRLSPARHLRARRIPRAVTIASPEHDERDIALELLPGPAALPFAQAVSEMDPTILRPQREDEPGRGPHLADPPAHRVDFWSCNGALTLERHGARTSPA